MSIGMEKEVFLSHSSSDSKEATRLCEYFEKNYINCFIAPRDIKVGASYAEELLDGLDNSKVLLLLLSNEANSSPHVLREVERAVSRSIPIVVYKLEYVELSKSMEYFLMTNQWREIKKNDDLSEIYSLVRNILREEETSKYIHDSEAGREMRESMTIAIDAALQENDNREKEAVGPGATETKNKMGTSSTGISTGIAESELNLQIALKLEKELKKRGYKVLMTRKSNNVNISNAKRAEMANAANVEALIRIDANVSEDSTLNGAMTICQTKNNPYNSEVHYQSRVLAEFILEEMVKATGCDQQNIWETDTMTFINWSKVPVTIVEVGYLSNVEEDKLLVTEEYQEKIAIGIANGIDQSVLTS